jgi:hypothetical protein
MKGEFRRGLAQQSFEERIRKVGELIQLSRKLKSQRTSERMERQQTSLISLVFVKKRCGIGR